MRLPKWFNTVKPPSWAILALIFAAGCRPEQLLRFFLLVVDDEHPTRVVHGALPNRFFSIVQRSYWIPDGADSAVVPVVDTMMILEPDPSHDSIHFSGEPGCCNGTLKLVRDTAGGIEVRILNNWLDPESAAGGLLLLAPDWEQTPGPHAPGPWSDSGTVRHRLSDVDSSVLVFTRQGRAGEWVRYAGARWLRMTATRSIVVSGRQTLEPDLSPAGTPVDFRYAGVIAERFLFEPQTGFVDSVEARGTLRGRLIYHESTGVPDSVLGAWRVERRAGWRYYANFDRDGVVFIDSARPDVARQQERALALRNSAQFAESALVLRVTQLEREALSPALRWPLDEAERRFTFNRDVSSLVLARALQPEARLRDIGILGSLAQYQSRVLPGSAMPAQTANALADRLMSLETERRDQVNRPGLFDTLATLLRSPLGIAPDAGEYAARVAQQTDDAAARDLLLLLAYRSDPARYLPLLGRLADRRPGSYGSIARAYTQGNIAPSFYGEHPDSFALTWTGRPFPGLSRPWREHVVYFEHLPEGAALERAQDPRSGATWLVMRGGESPDYASMGRAVQLLLRSHGMDANAALSARFTAETDPRGRLVWAHYLLSMEDTTLLPWVRSAYRGADRALASDALRLLELHRSLAQDTRIEPAILGSIQNAVLDCITGRTALVDSAGAPVGECSRHGDRLPTLLQSDGLAPAAVSRWKRDFTLRSHVEFLQRARSSMWGGFPMAVTLTPVRRIENRYYIDYAVAPGTGVGCMCGYGGSFVLVQQAGHWVAWGTGRWIS